jgi:monothiol glutaredoxin
MLKILEVNFQGVNVLEDQNIREGIKVYSDWPTIPQLYIKKEFVGGCDIVKEMYESGELAKLLEAKGISFKAKN